MEYPTPEQVAESMREWDVPASGEHAVIHWLRMLAESRWFATGIYFPVSWNGDMGVCLCVSTPEVARVSKANLVVDEYKRSRRGIDTPEWLLHDVYFYANIVFGNFHGFRHASGRFLGTMEYVLDQLCRTAGIVDWRRDVFVPDGEWMYGGLRRVLARLRIPVHAEVVSGLSYRALSSLDVFIAIHSPSMGYEPAGMALWVASGAPRRFPTQDQWWFQDVFRPWGESQYGNLLDYRVDFASSGNVPAVLAVYPLAVTGSASASMRMRVVLGHVPDLAMARRMASQLPPVRPHVSPQQRAIMDGREEEESRM